MRIPNHQHNGRIRINSPLIAPAVLILLFLLSHPVRSQILPFHTYAGKEGLIGNRITDISQDSRGYLWISTFDGLSRFDGQTFQNFTTTDGLPSSLVWCATASSAFPGTVLMGTEAGGVTRFANGAFSTIHVGTGPVNDILESIFEDPDGRVWCTTGKSVRTVRGDSVSVVVDRQDTSGFTNVVRTSDGSHWVGILRRLYHISPSGVGIDSSEIPLTPKDIMTHLMADSDGTLWIGTWAGSVMHWGKGAVIADRMVASPVPIRAATIDRSGTLWFASKEGLRRVSRERFATDRIESITTKNGLNDEEIVALLSDREDNLWGGSWHNGLFKLAQKNLFFFPPPAREIYLTVILDSAGHGWMLLDRSIVELWHGSAGWQTAEHPLFNEGDGLHAGLLFRSHDYLCVSSLTGNLRIYRITSRRDRASDFAFAFEVPNEGFSKPHGWFHVFEESPGRIWYNLENFTLGLVDLHQRKVVKVLKYPGDVPLASVRAMATDRDSNLWIGSFGEGLVYLPHGDWQAKKFIRVTAKEGLPDLGIRALFVDRENRVWIGTRYGGAAYFSNGAFHALDMDSGMVSNTVWSIDQSRDGKLWLATSLGLESIDPGKPRSPAIVQETRGLNIGFCGFDADQRMWLLSNEGIAIYDYTKTVEVRTPPEVFISQVSVNGSVVNLQRKSSFAHDENNVQIQYLGISLKSPEEVRYRYRLEGVDDEWSPLTGQNRITYASLNPGTYTFQVSAVNGAGIESAEAASCTFTIGLPYWRTWWFIALANVAVLAVIGLGALRRLRTLQRERHLQHEFSKQLLSLQEEERKRIAAELHDSIGQDLLIIKNRSARALHEDTPAAEVSGHLREINEITSATMQDVRRISYNLRPYQIDRLGMTKALRSLIDAFVASSGLACSVHLDPIDGILGRSEEIHLYRIAQEILNNVGKHANATSVEIVIALTTASSITMKIADNGKGIPQEPQDRGAVHPGLGLEGIAERVRILGGSHAVTSAPGHGTTITITIPYGNREKQDDDPRR